MREQKILALTTKLAPLSPEKRAHLISYLPDNIRNEIEKDGADEQTLPTNLTIEKIARRVDVSHFKTYLDTLSTESQRLYVTAFPKFKQVQLTGANEVYTEYASKGFSNYILLMLYKKTLKDFPPPTILPMHPIAALLGDTGISLSTLITYLALFDVVAEIKQIISKEILQNLQDVFDPREIAFMNKIARANKTPILSAMNLRCFNGDATTLRALLEERGIYRFTQGIKNAPAQYHFYFIYFLPKPISDKVKILLTEQATLGKGYLGWQEDALETWRFLCTYSR